MTVDQFKTVRHFTPAEWQPLEGLSPDLVYAVDAWREWHGHPFIVHDAFSLDGHLPGSQHALGLAVDGHIPGLSIWDQWLLAEQWPAFTGIGVYPFMRSTLYADGWTHPGVHLDIRPSAQRVRWYRDGDGRYHGLNAVALARLVGQIA